MEEKKENISKDSDKNLTEQPENEIYAPEEMSIELQKMKNINPEDFTKFWKIIKNTKDLQKRLSTDNKCNIAEWKKKRFKEITDEMYLIFEAKNHDYTANSKFGSAFDFTYDLLGPTAPVVRLLDKVLRYMTLASGSDPKVSDEKIEDTLTDLANYAILTRIKIEQDKKFQNKN